MNKIIKLLILYSSLLLHCCKGHKVNIVPDDNQSHNRSKRSLDNKQKETDIKVKKENITLTAEEQKKFKSLNFALEKVIEKLQNQIAGCQNDKSKCTNFFNWISKNEHKQKQKELANAFTKVYDFLEKKRQKKAHDKDFDTYISDAIECQVNNHDCNKDNKYGNDDNEIEKFFRGILNDMSLKDNNEKMFECLKKELLCTDDSNKHFDGLTTNWQD
ncbi:Mlp family lipoprotein [Borrelia persica]|uniref:Mlp family lipoprotein n=1 Tax=Borrelia persica TaxID=44448 RepID=UPI0004673210|nr:Mlp family lipoprotein [Borrelia persica]